MDQKLFVKFYKEYKLKPSTQLKLTRAQLVGVLGNDNQPNVVERIAAINSLLKKRRDEDPEAKPPFVDIHKEFDYFAAVKFAAKVDSSKVRNIPFELTLDEFKALLKIKRCYYTGRRLVDREQVCKDSRTLDRIDCTIGYTRENTVACTYGANQLKNELFERPDGHHRMTPKQVQMLVEKVVKKL